MAVLTAPTKQTPYPYAATGIAAYSDKTEIVFDDTATSTSFAIDGRTIDNEEAIVHAIAKDADIPDDEEKVLQPTYEIYALTDVGSRHPILTKPKTCETSIAFLKLFPFWMLLMITSLSEHSL
jgi:hypothetical protein